jgi:hypothetical protein
MAKNVADVSPKTDQAPVPAIPVAELDEASVAAVAGGINPQPLPPGRHPSLD